MKASKIIWGTVWVAFLTIIFRKLVWDEFNGEVIGSAIFGAFFGVIIFEYFAFKQFGTAGKYLANSVPQVQLSVNEILILQGAANYLKGKVGVGGRLTLTNERLIFQSHAFNLTREEREIPVVSVKQVDRAEGEKVLRLDLTNNEIHKFVVESPSRWMEAIPHS